MASSRSRSAAEAAMTRARGSETGRLRSRIATIDRKAPSSVARRRRHARRVACLPAGDAGVRAGRRRSRRRPPARERPKARRGARDPPVTDPVACSVTPGRPRLAPQTTLARRGASRYSARPSSDRRVGRTYAAPEPVEGLRHGGSNRGFGSSAANDPTGNSAGPRSATALSAGLSRSDMSHHKFWANYRGMGGALDQNELTRRYAAPRRWAPTTTPWPPKPPTTTSSSTAKTTQCPTSTNSELPQTDPRSGRIRAIRGRSRWARWWATTSRSAATLCHLSRHSPALTSKETEG